VAIALIGALLYLGAAQLIFRQLPFSSIPSAWLLLWPAKRVAVLTWWAFLNLSGAVVSATVPVLFLRLLRPNSSAAFGFCISIPASIFAILPNSPSEFGDILSTSGAIWQLIEVAGLIFASVPALMLASGQFRGGAADASNYRFERP